MNIRSQYEIPVPPCKLYIHFNDEEKEIYNTGFKNGVKTGFIDGFFVAGILTLCLLVPFILTKSKPIDTNQPSIQQR